MKKHDTHKFYTGNTGGHNKKKTDAVVNGKYFSFYIQIKREDGKIYVKEISNDKTIFCSILESTRKDTKTNVSLLKSHLISEVLRHLERGFDTLENPIGGRKPKDSANDFQIKKAA